MTALISTCGKYRFWLYRHLDVPSPSNGVAMFIMLNPSTADATKDDPTIRRCKTFARNWGCSSVWVFNLYALRTTDPSILWKQPDPIGRENDHYLRDFATKNNFSSGVNRAVCAWGVNAKPERVAQVRDILTNAGAHLWCLGTTKDGHPRHPLYVKGGQQLLPWPSAKN